MQQRTELNSNLEFIQSNTQNSLNLLDIFGA